jgi:hypothetical protein
MIKLLILAIVYGDLWEVLAMLRAYSRLAKPALERRGKGTCCM